MVDWQKHGERVDEARSNYQRVGRETFIYAAAVAEAERKAIMDPAERAVALKGKGISTARRNAIHFV